MPIGLNWKYFIQLPSGRIVVVGSQELLSSTFIGIIKTNQQKTTDEQKEIELFVNKLLIEAEKEKKQLFKPIKDFNGKYSLKSYSLTNLYLSNYISAEFMMGTAKIEEAEITHKGMQFDPETFKAFNSEKEKHVSKNLFAQGTYFSATISFFFMALEGFVNILFHAFLKNDLRKLELNLEQRLDLEQKIMLMPSLCSGFKDNYFDRDHEIYKKFKKLKKYRNSLFHSKIEDSLKLLYFYEDTFIYNCNMDDYKDDFFSSLKQRLTIHDVSETKKIVDNIIGVILDLMEDEAREFADEYILQEQLIGFQVFEDGVISPLKPKKA